MVAWTPHRLPIVVAPVPGEALDSWIEAYARRLRVCSSDLLDHLGLAAARLANMVMLLTAPERDTLTITTGIDPPRLAAMTLQRFDGIAVALNHARRAAVHPPAWRRQTGSRFCPACLGETEGRWQLTWRLPWNFACPTHHCLLIDLCPTCRRRPTPHRHGIGEATTGGVCTAPARTSQPRRWRVPLCGHDLTTIPTSALPAAGPVLAAHEHIQQLITSAVTNADLREGAQRSLAELHTLAHKALAALHHTGHRPEIVERILVQCGGHIPTPRGLLDSFDAHAVAVGTAIAATAHRNGPAADQVLAWIIDSDRHMRRPAEPGRLLAPWHEAGPELTTRILAVLDLHLTVHDRLAYSTAYPAPRQAGPSPPDLERRTASLPALLWPTWSMCLVPATKTRAANGLEGARAALAALTLIPECRLSYRQALDLLGSHAPRSSIGRLLASLDPDQLTATIRLLTQLAHVLDTNPAPIDYTRRRALLAAGATVDRAAYATLAAERGWNPPSTLQLRILNHHLAIVLTGAHRPPSDPHRPGAVEVWNPLLFTLPLTVRQFVGDQARKLLHDHGINEPLTWQPPLPAPPAAGWPGIEPETIDAQRFTHAIAEHAQARCAAARLGEATELRGLHLHLATYVLDLDMPEQQWNDLADGANRDPVDPNRLRQLYHDQNLPLHQIARLALTSERLLRRALIKAGTVPQSSRPRRANIPRVLFEQHYLNTGKSLQQAAADAGYSRNTFSKYAHQHGIPVGTQVNPFTTWPEATRPPPAVVTACSWPRGVEYLENILRMPGHTTRRAAAAAIGITEKCLCQQRQRIERETGIRIFQQGTPLTTTPEGATFLENATEALHRLDQLRPNHRDGPAQPGP